MNAKIKLFPLLVLLLFYVLIPKSAWAFYCVVDGATGGSGRSLPVRVNAPSIQNKLTDDVLIVDLKSKISCSGGLDDALVTYSASINPNLSAIGFTGYVQVNDGATQYDFPPAISQMCVWPNSACSSIGASGTAPVPIKIGLRRNAVVGSAGVVLAAGSIIATVQTMQRSQGSWGWVNTWDIVLNTPLVIPAYTCATDGKNHTLNFESVEKSDLITNGPGRYNKEHQQITINLACTPETSVGITFDGPKMAGKSDVLANQTSGNDNVGFQILYNNAAINIGENMEVIDSAQANESLKFDAYYYYNGGAVNGGPVTSSAIFTFNYH